MMQAKNIQEVVAILNTIIQQSTQQHSRMGYFACLYRKMTLAVIQGIEQGLFEDGARMELLDVLFANRYFEAYSSFVQGKNCTRSWHFAFDTAQQKHTVIQHLLLGINAHINLDLGIAAALTAKNKDVHSLQNDFNKINQVIGSLVNSVQQDLEDICFPMKFVRFVDNKSKDAVINFSMKIARDTAWSNAIALSLLPDQQWSHYINSMDQKVALVAHNITRPKLSEHFILKMVQLFESKQVAAIIASLKD